MKTQTRVICCEWANFLINVYFSIFSFYAYTIKCSKLFKHLLRKMSNKIVVILFVPTVLLQTPIFFFFFWINKYNHQDT